MSDQQPEKAHVAEQCDGCLMLAMVERAERAEAALARLGINPRVINGVITPPAGGEQ